MNRKEEQVAKLYTDLWRELKDIQEKSVIEQFLYNVGLPGEWFEGKRCLDVGCGIGCAVWVLKHLKAESFACDLALQGLVESAKKFPELRTALANATVLCLPYPANFFDFVYCNGVLHHTTDPRQGFLELVRVTKTAGVLFISVYGKGGWYNMALHLGRVAARTIPISWSEFFLDLLLKERTVPNSFMPAKVSVLDNLYVPIRNSYYEREIYDWFDEAGIDEITRTKTTIYDHQKTINRVIHGEGYLQFRGKKN